MQWGIFCFKNKTFTKKDMQNSNAKQKNNFCYCKLESAKHT